MQLLTNKLLRLLFLSILTIGSHNLFSQRNLLSGKYNVDQIRNSIVSHEYYRPFPPAGSEEWNIIPEGDRKKIIKKAESLRNYDYPVLKASAYLEFVRTGNRSNYQSAYNKRRSVISNLLLAEILENKGRFLDDIINGVWAICEESSWVIPAHIDVQKEGHGLPDVTEPVTGILASETPSLLAAVEYFLGDRLDDVNPLIRKRMHDEVEQRFLEVMMNRDDFWWMGFEDSFTNNWNPWVISNYINAILIFEKDQEKRAQSLHRAMVILDNFLNIYPDDGGCDEGPAYWNHAGGRMFNCLELLYNASEGAIDIFHEPLIKNMGDYLWKAFIHDNWFVNFADAPARITPPFYVAFRYGRMTESEQLMAFSQLFFERNENKAPSTKNLLLRTLPGWLSLPEIQNYQGEFHFSEYEVLPDLEFFTARQSNNPEEGFYVAAKGGFNAESHNHNDAGSFIVYLEGEPLLIDAGVGTYNAKTFSSQRYDIWTMQSSYHNLPEINGMAQPYGAEFRAGQFQAENRRNSARLIMELSTAYPGEAGVNEFKREIELDRRNRRVNITDSFGFKHNNNSLSFHFLSNHIPESEDGYISLKDPVTGIEKARLVCKDLSFDLQKIDIEDERLIKTWGNTLYRIALRAENLAGKADFTFHIEK